MTDYISIDEAVTQLSDGGLNSDTGNDETNTVAETADEGVDSNEISQDDPDDLEINDEDGDESPAGDDVEDGSEDGDEGPAIEAPQYWDKAQRERFKELPRDVQKYLKDREAESESYISQKVKAAAEEAKVANEHAAKLSQYREHVESLYNRANQIFADRWSNVNWADEYARDPDGALMARAQYERELAEKQQLDAVAAQQRQTALHEFRLTENQKLQTMAQADRVTAKLFDPQHGQETQKKVVDYLAKRGFPMERLGEVSADETDIVLRAMLYDELVAKKATKGSGQQAQGVTQSSTKMRSSSTPSQPQQTRVQDKYNAFESTGSAEDAVAYLMAKKTSNKRK